ncbi:MAG: hypothetical protein V3U47_05035 [Acidimicrobiia bacterium]
MSRGHRILAAIVPSPRRQWVLAHEAEYDVIEGRWQRSRWALGLVPIVGFALVSQLRHDPRSFLGGALMKAAIFTLSILNVAAGMGLLVLYVSQPSPPAFVLVLSLALLAQGSYTIAFIAGALRSHHEVARRAQLGGSMLALVAGTVGFAVGLFANINPVNADPEYGPMTIALLIAGHGFFSLLAFIPPRTVKTNTH